MTNEQLLAIKAIHSLSSMAADFKSGVVDNDYIRTQLFNAFAALGLPVSSVLTEVGKAMVYWGEYEDSLV